MERRQIRSHAEAKSAFEPYQDLMVKSMQEAFNDFQKTCDTGSYYAKESRTKANLLHDSLKHHIEKNFRDIPNVVVGVWNRIFAIKINDDLFIRFKKLNDKYQPSSLPTRQSKKYENQLSIDGIPNKPTFLYAGYTIDKSWGNILKMSIVCWENSHMHWVEDLVTNIAVLQPEIFDKESDNTEILKPKRVKVKTQKDAV
jgi:hypothetical protein